MRNAFSVATAFALAVHAALSCVALSTPSRVHAQSQGDEPTLPSVDVSGSPAAGARMPPYAGGQVARGGQLGLLGNADFMDTPFNQASYTAELIEDLQATRLADLLVSDPSVRMGTARANFQEYLSIRGFLYGSQDVAFNGMYGLTPYMRPPLEMAERVEALKGPSAALNGMPPYGSTGGAINIVPKRAAAAPLARVTASYLSDSQAGVHADLGRRFGEDNAFGARLNAAYRDGETTIDRHKQQDALVTLGLDYQGERMRASVDLLHEDQAIDNFVRQFAVSPTVTAIPAAPDTGLNYPGYGQLTATDSMATGRIEYDFADDLTLYAAMGRRNHETDAIGSVMLLLLPGGTYVSPPGWQILVVETTSYAAGATARFETGAIKHKAAATVSLLEDRQDTFFVSPIGSLRVNNLYEPVAQDLPSTAGISPVVGNYQDSKLTSYALADTVSFLEERVQLTLGARHQSVQVQAYDPTTHLPAGDKYDESLVTPVVGLLVKPSPGLSLYANYSEDLAKGPSALPPAVTVATMLPPIRTKQAEVGAKYDRGKFAATASAFQIERPSAAAEGGVLARNGEQRNRGVELNAFGELMRDVRTLGGVTFMRGELAKTPGGLHDGNDAIAVPHVQASLGADWDHVLAAGFSLGARLIYTGSQYVDQANRLKLPAWTRLDAGAKYATRVAAHLLTLRLNVENLFDKSWWGSSNAFANGDASGGFLYLGTGRTVMLSATMDFQGSRALH